MKKSIKAADCNTKRVKTNPGAKLPKGLRPWVVMPPREDTPWVKTSECKPEIGKTVFVGKRSGRVDFVSMAFFGNGEIYNLRGEPFPISEAPFWMPIPPLPKEGK